MGKVTKGSEDYISNRAWLRAAVGGKDLILCNASALEYLQMFVGYLNEKTIEVYAKEQGEYDNVIYHIVNSFDGIDYVEIDGVLCCSFQQVVEDMISDWDNSDAQALTEALSQYYFAHGESFEGIACKSNPELLEEIKSWAKEYYNY